MYNLLLVDDEVDTREALSCYFPWHEVGFQVVGQASNGREALAYMTEKESVDIVLTDIKMPIMSGIELAEAIYERKMDTHVIFLSSYREFEYAQQALKYRVKNYVVKPAKYQVLFEVFSSLREELKAVEWNNVHFIPEADLSSNDEGLVIAQIKSYVQNHYKEASLDAAAKQVHLNANYLSYLFKQKTGQNFTDYLIKVKMENALMLLLDARYRTYEISEMVGYSNAKNFTRTFKSYYGKTPSEYRSGMIHL